ncbi:phage minor head protein [Burkholderia anthina]|uniref:phage head morphogenesis protein n=1 Tax=Burkholderia anthina TaxID=179879 RepID=UPI00158BF409|nr:phage minor head protein [Burkholderia anthina]
MATIAANLRLEPADAVAYFRSKGIEITWDWHEMRREAHAKGFTVAKATSVDVMHALRDMTDKAVRGEITFEQFKQQLRPQLQDLGWWGRQEVLDGETGELTMVQLGSNRRLRTIFQTNVAVAYSVGLYKRLRDNVDNRPYWRYLAVMDGRTRPSHRALHGKVFRWDDPIWDVIFPPNGWGCRCIVQALTEEEFQELGVPLLDGSQSIETIEVPINKAGDMMDVRVVRFVDELGREQIFRPDPGWDYNPGAGYAEDQALSNVLAAKIDKVPPATGATVAANITRNPEGQQQIDRAWQSWTTDVIGNAPGRNRQMLLGFVRPAEVSALAKRDAPIGSIPLMVDERVVRNGLAQLPSAASGRLSTTDWLDLSTTLREPHAVLLDRANGTLMHVLPHASGDEQRIVVESTYGQTQARTLATNVRSVYLALARGLQALVGAAGAVLISGSLD